MWQLKMETEELLFCQFFGLDGGVVRDEAVKYTLDCLHFAASGNNSSSNKPLSILGGLFHSVSPSHYATLRERDTQT